MRCGRARELQLHTRTKWKKEKNFKGFDSARGGRHCMYEAPAAAAPGGGR